MHRQKTHAGFTTILYSRATDLASEPKSIKISSQNQAVTDLNRTLSPQKITCLALTVVAAGFALRLYGLGRESLWYDELLQLDIAQGPLGQLAPRLRGHSGVPLDYIISHFWIMLGRGDAWVRVPALVAGVLSVALAYRVGRALLGYPTALIFSLLLALSPFHIQYSQEARPYALVVLGGLLLVYGFWQLEQTGRWRYAIALQVGVLIATLAHIFALVLIVALLLFLAVDGLFFRRGRHTLLTTVALLGSLLLPLLVFVGMGWFDVLFYSSREFTRALVEPGQGLSAKNPALPPQIVLDNRFFKDDIFSPLAGSSAGWGIAVIGGLAVAGAIALAALKKWRTLLLLVLWLLLPPLVIVPFLMYRQTFFAPRYIILSLPALLLLVTAGLMGLPGAVAHTGRPKLAAGLGLVLAAGLLLAWGGNLFDYYRLPHKENWHLVADFIAANANPNDAVIAVHAEPTLNWYYPPAAAVPNTYNKLATIKQKVAQSRRAWVILSIFSAEYDARVKAWLSEQHAVRLTLDPVIAVYYLGHNVPPNQLLTEIQSFALPVNAALYASLARENRHRPNVARRYWHLAIAHAPNPATRARYQAELDALK